MESNNNMQIDTNQQQQQQQQQQNTKSLRALSPIGIVRANAMTAGLASLPWLQLLAVIIDRWFITHLFREFLNIIKCLFLKGIQFRLQRCMVLLVTLHDASIGNDYCFEFDNHEKKNIVL